MNKKLRIFKKLETEIVSPLPNSILGKYKRSFTTRNVDAASIKTLITGNIAPVAGDLVLARVKSIKKHTRIELINGRRCRLFKDDLVLLAYGNRYAPDQFESEIPDHLGPCHMVAGGGIASYMISKAPTIKAPTEIIPMGLIGDINGERINLNQFIKKCNQHVFKRMPQFLCVGSSMNSGKTTTAANLVHSMQGDGFKVAAIKITGTGSGCDLWHFDDAGAHFSADFTDSGYATTYKLTKNQLIDIYEHLFALAVSQGVDVIVTEIADGILQQETKTLLESKSIKQGVSAVFFSAPDSCSAMFGSKQLEQLGYSVAGISGVVTSNPLLKHESQQHLDQNIPVVTTENILKPGFSNSLVQEYSDFQTLVSSGVK